MEKKIKLLPDGCNKSYPIAIFASYFMNETIQV